MEEEGNMITNWLDQHGNPEIEKLVEQKLMDKMDKIALEEAKQVAWMEYEHVEGNLYSTSFKNGFELGAKWQAERMYSEEDMQEYAEFCVECDRSDLKLIVAKDWFKQFKKK